MVPRRKTVMPNQTHKILKCVYLSTLYMREKTDKKVSLIDKTLKRYNRVHSCQVGRQRLIQGDIPISSLKREVDSHPQNQQRSKPVKVYFNYIVAICLYTYLFGGKRTHFYGYSPYRPSIPSTYKLKIFLDGLIKGFKNVTKCKNGRHLLSGSGRCKSGRGPLPPVKSGRFITRRHTVTSKLNVKTLPFYSTLRRLYE